MARPRGQVRGDVTKARIRQVAAELFTRNGFHNTGMAELADTAGLGKGALYYHIESKEALLFEICSEHIYEMAAFARSVVSSSATPIEKFEVLSERLLQTICDNRNELTLMFRELDSLTGERREKFVAVRREYERAWQSVIEEGVQAGQFRSVDPVLIKGILGMHNYAYVWIRSPGRLDPKEISVIFRDALLRGLVSRNSDTTET